MRLQGLQALDRLRASVGGAAATRSARSRTAR